MNVKIPEPTRKTLRTLDQKTRKLIGAEIRKWQNDLPVDIKKLKTERNHVRLAVGEWRIMFEARFEEGEKVYYATDVIMRKDAYR